MVTATLIFILPIIIRSLCFFRAGPLNQSSGSHIPSSCFQAGMWTRQSNNSSAACLDRHRQSSLDCLNCVTSFRMVIELGFVSLGETNAPNLRDTTISETSPIPGEVTTGNPLAKYSPSFTGDATRFTGCSSLSMKATSAADRK